MQRILQVDGAVASEARRNNSPSASQTCLIGQTQPAATDPKAQHTVGQVQAGGGQGVASRQSFRKLCKSEVLLGAVKNSR